MDKDVNKEKTQSWNKVTGVTKGNVAEAKNSPFWEGSLPYKKGDLIRSEDPAVENIPPTEKVRMDIRFKAYDCIEALEELADVMAGDLTKDQLSKLSYYITEELDKVETSVKLITRAITI